VGLIPRNSRTCPATKRSKTRKEPGEKRRGGHETRQPRQGSDKREGEANYQKVRHCDKKKGDLGGDIGAKKWEVERLTSNRKPRRRKNRELTGATKCTVHSREKQEANPARGPSRQRRRKKESDIKKLSTSGKEIKCTARHAKGDSVPGRWRKGKAENLQRKGDQTMVRQTPPSKKKKSIKQKEIRDRIKLRQNTTYKVLMGGRKISVNQVFPPNRKNQHDKDRSASLRKKEIKRTQKEDTVDSHAHHSKSGYGSGGTTIEGAGYGEIETVERQRQSTLKKTARDNHKARVST